MLVPSRSPTRRLLRWLLINLAVTALLLVLIEGVASFIIAGRLVEPAPLGDGSPRQVAERQHTEYDPLLGWVNTPGVAVPDLYGPGRNVTINCGGFRGPEEVAEEREAARPRLVVSGDSFTFGYGVGDHDTWAAQLKQRQPSLEVINMGLGGYGLGQAFLWYQRDGHALPHDVHLFAFITENFRRMTRDRFMGYGKPVVTARDGKLVVENVPPPRIRTQRWLQRYQKAIADLSLVRWLGDVADAADAAQAEREQNVEEAILLTFDEVHRLHREAGRAGALVYLPIESDYHDGDSNAWRRWLAREAIERDWIFIDLVREFRRLPVDRIPKFFIQRDSGRFRGSKGHYTEEGNAWVAETLHRHLLQHPAIASRLTPAERRAPASHQR